MSNPKKIVKTIKLTQEEWDRLQAILDNGLDHGFYADAYVQGPKETKVYNQVMEKLGGWYPKYIIKEETKDE